MFEWFMNYLSFGMMYLSDLTPGKFIMMLLPCFLLDTPRYVLSKYVLFIYEQFRIISDSLNITKSKIEYKNLPFISIIVPGYNEEDGIIHTIDSLLENKYPRAEIIVVDDGSTDETFSLCAPYAERGLIVLLRKNIAGGKTSAANMGLSVAKGEIIIIVDSDTSFDNDSLYNIVKPFADPKIGVVSGNIRVRNWHESLIARYQAAEYLHCITLGRRLHSAVGTLNIASGAFGAFRKDALITVGGWDVGPGEDGDLTAKVRKLGYQVVFADDAVCHTSAPDNLLSFVKQRLRWSRGVIRYRLRKHVNMANPFHANFRGKNFLIVADALLFRVILPFLFPIYMLRMLLLMPEVIPLVMMLTWCVYAFSNLLQIPLVLYYSCNKREDARILLATFIMSPYNLLHRTIRLTSMVQEIFFRKSYSDPYVPKRVRDKTIHW